MPATETPAALHMSAAPPTAPERFLTLRDLVQLTTLKPSRLRQMVAAGLFPAPIRVSANRIAWRSADVAQWQSACPPVTQGA